MTSRKIFALMAALALLAINSIANAGIVDPANSSAVLATSPGIMTVAPGGADSFIIPNNYQIDVYLNDSGNNPVEVIATDIWVDDPVVSWCAGGVIADSSTFAPDAGHTTFTGTPRGGVFAAAAGFNECSAISMDVIAVGNLIASLDLQANSPDLNGDGHVTVADFGLFAGSFQGTDSCADYNESGGGVTVADFGIFAGFFNISDCP